MLLKSINDSFALAERKKWDRVYWAIDIHGTIVKPTYSNEQNDSFYTGALAVLHELSNRPDICLILYSCSYPDKIEYYINKFKKLGIVFDYVNCNPEVKDNDYSSYKEKFYFNVILDDKAGFDPETDWSVVQEGLDNNHILTHVKNEYGLEYHVMNIQEDYYLHTKKEDIPRLKKALILEDNKDRQKAFKNLLIFKQYDVTFVEHSKDCIEHLINNKYDIIFLDHDLNGKQMDYDIDDCGSNVAEWLKEYPTTTLTIIHTYHEEKGYYMNYLIKPSLYIRGAWLPDRFEKYVLRYL